MFITFHTIIFESQTLLVQKCWHENRVWPEIATEGHSRSFILQLQAGKGLLVGINNVSLIVRFSRRLQR